MSEDTYSFRFSEKADIHDHAYVYFKIMEMAVIWEDDKGIMRRTVCDALIDAAIKLSYLRPDERFFQHPRDVKNFLDFAYNAIKFARDGHPSEEGIANIEKQFGKNLKVLRDSKRLQKK